MSYRQAYPDAINGEYTYTATKKKLDLNYIYNLLCVPSQYSTGLPLERFPLVLENSVCFGVFHNGKQVGFARVISDHSEFASLLDHPYLRGTFRWFLMTEDAHGLYQKYGFKTEAYNPYVMMKVNIGI
jgi:hypothetical protein